MNQRIESIPIELDSLLKEVPEKEPPIVLISDFTINRAIDAQEAGENALAKELTKELKSFAKRYRQEFVDEATERMRKEHLPADEAMNAVIAHVADRIRESLSVGVPALSEEKERTLRRELMETDSLLQNQRSGKSAGKRQQVSNPYAYELLLEKKIRLEKQLYPDRAENIIDSALIDKADVDADTRVNATLFPHLAKKERQRFELEEAEHQEIMTQKRHAMEAAADHHLDLNEEEPPTLSGQTPLKPRTLWQRLTGRG